MVSADWFIDDPPNADRSDAPRIGYVLTWKSSKRKDHVECHYSSGMRLNLETATYRVYTPFSCCQLTPTWDRLCLASVFELISKAKLVVCVDIQFNFLCQFRFKYRKLLKLHAVPCDHERLHTNMKPMSVFHGRRRSLSLSLSKQVEYQRSWFTLFISSFPYCPILGGVTLPVPSLSLCSGLEVCRDKN